MHLPRCAPSDAFYQHEHGLEATCLVGVQPNVVLSRHVPRLCQVYVIIEAIDDSQSSTDDPSMQCTKATKHGRIPGLSDTSDDEGPLGAETFDDVDTPMPRATAVRVYHSDSDTDVDNISGSIVASARRAGETVDDQQLVASQRTAVDARQARTMRHAGKGVARGAVDVRKDWDDGEVDVDLLGDGADLLSAPASAWERAVELPGVPVRQSHYAFGQEIVLGGTQTKVGDGKSEKMPVGVSKAMGEVHVSDSEQVKKDREVLPEAGASSQVSGSSCEGDAVEGIDLDDVQATAANAENDNAGRGDGGNNSDGQSEDRAGSGAIEPAQAGAGGVTDEGLWGQLFKRAAGEGGSDQVTGGRSMWSCKTSSGETEQEMKGTFIDAPHVDRIVDDFGGVEDVCAVDAGAVEPDTASELDEVRRERRPAGSVIGPDFGWPAAERKVPKRARSCKEPVGRADDVEDMHNEEGAEQGIFVKLRELEKQVAAERRELKRSKPRKPRSKNSSKAEDVTDSPVVAEDLRSCAPIIMKLAF
jgi:hypothetical protein